VTLGLIGATGRQGQRYLMGRNGGDAISHWYSRAPTVEQRAAIDSDVTRWEGEEWDDFLNVCDSVIIATPTPTHYELTKRCLLAGKSVLVEKPLAETYKQCLELIELAEAQGVKLMVAHTHVHGERWRACASAAASMGLRLRVTIPLCTKTEQLQSWLPHAAAIQFAVGQKDSVGPEQSGVARIRCEWWREGLSIGWSAVAEDTAAASPMRHQLNRFLGNWSEDLRAIYGMVFGKDL
jgi:hypothetical protein